MSITPEPWPPTITLERNGVRLEPLALAHEAELAAAAADGELWNIRVTSVPEPAPWALMLWAGAAGWAGLRRRTHSHAAARLRR